MEHPDAHSTYCLRKRDILLSEYPVFSAICLYVLPSLSIFITKLLIFLVIFSCSFIIDPPMDLFIKILPFYVPIETRKIIIYVPIETRKPILSQSASHFVLV